MRVLGLSITRAGRRVMYAQKIATKTAANTKELDARLQRLENTAEELQPPHNHDEYLDKSRAKIAFKFVRWYLFYVLLVIIGVPIYNRYAVGAKETIDIFKVLAQVGTLLGTPLGFVVGYYFKESNNQSN